MLTIIFDGRKPHFLRGQVFAFPRPREVDVGNAFRAYLQGEDRDRVAVVPLARNAVLRSRLKSASHSAETGTLKKRNIRQSNKASMEIQIWPIDKLVPYARNPRKNDGAVDQMCGALREFGFKIPCLVRGDGEVIDVNPAIDRQELTFVFSVHTGRWRALVLLSR